VQAAFVVMHDDACGAESAVQTLPLVAAARPAASADRVRRDGRFSPRCRRERPDRAGVFARRTKNSTCLPRRPPKLPRPASAAPADEDKGLRRPLALDDDYVQPMQKVRANQERNRTFRGELDLATTENTRSSPMPRSRQVRSAIRQARHRHRRRAAYRRLGDYIGRFADYYLVDSATGAPDARAQAAAQRNRRRRRPRDNGRPDGKWAAYFHRTSTGTR